MEIISYTSIRANLAQKMRQVCENHESLIITRAKKKPVAMLSLENYEALIKKTYLL